MWAAVREVARHIHLPEDAAGDEDSSGEDSCVRSLPNFLGM